MALPNADDLDGLSLVELRGLVVSLIGQVRQLTDENRALREEVARLKGLPPRPPARPSPSGMEAASERSRAAPGRKRRGPLHERSAVIREMVLKAEVAQGSRFKGYEDVLVRDLRLEAQVIRYRRERWLTPEGATVVAALPPGLAGGFGPHLRRFLLAAHVQGQVTSERLVALLSGIGLIISKRQVVRLLSGPLDTFVAEDEAVLRAGLSSAAWISVDDTTARHARADGFTTQIGDARFTVFRTGPSKSLSQNSRCAVEPRGRVPGDREFCEELQVAAELPGTAAGWAPGLRVPHKTPGRRRFPFGLDSAAGVL